MDLQKAIAERQKELKIHQFGFTTTDCLSIHQGVRDLCEMKRLRQIWKELVMSSGGRNAGRMQRKDYEVPECFCLYYHASPGGFL